MRVRLEYARTGLDVELPDERVVRSLSYKNARPLADPAAEVARVLARPTGAPPLAQLARGRKDACVVISDITRPVPNQLILEPLLATLEAQGIAREKITILVATGLYRPSTRAELVEMVGPQFVERYQIVDHHGQELS